MRDKERGLLADTARELTAAMEKRAAGYSELLLAGLEATARSNAAAKLGSAAVETAAGIWSRALAGAEVTGTGASMLTPEALAYAGRHMVRSGEAVFFMSNRDPGRPRLVPCITTEVIDAAHRYRITTAVPPGRQEQRTVPASRVLHFRWSIDPDQPWVGIGPYGRAPTVAKLAATVEKALATESGAPIALMIPVPAGESNLEGIAEDIANAQGGAVMAEGTASGWEEGRRAGTTQDWAQRRIGPAPPEEVVTVNRDAFAIMLAVAGIPASLAAGAARADGTQLREDYRRFVLSSVEPMARVMEQELRAKLREPLALSFWKLWAHDVQGRATALARLVEARVPLPEARRIAGLR